MRPQAALLASFCISVLCITRPRSPTLTPGTRSGGTWQITLFPISENDLRRLRLADGDDAT